MDSSARTRVVLFTSGIRGYWMLRYLLRPEVQSYYGIVVVGVATDDPQQDHSNASVRAVWQGSYDTEFEPKLVRRLCQQHEIPCYTGSIKTEYFIRMFSLNWRPEILLMNVFGQRLPKALFSFPRLGAYNFHTTAGDSWPRFGGPAPLRDIKRSGLRACRIACHHVSAKIDDGALVQLSEQIPILRGSSVDDMQLSIASLVVCFLKEVFPLLLQEQKGNYSESHLIAV